MLARQSHWYSDLRESIAHDTNPLPSGWCTVLTTICTVYVHREQDKVQVERPCMFDEETGALVIEDVTIHELDAYLAVLYPKLVSSGHKYDAC